MTTQQEVIRVIAEVLEIPAGEIRERDRFIEDLGANSLDIVNLIWRIEEAFSLGETSESQLEQIQTVSDLVDLVRAQRLDEPSEVRDAFDVILASDHAGVRLKAELTNWLRDNQYSALDLGPTDTKSVDYPDFAVLVARRVASGEARWGVLVCGSGIGMAISANKVHGVRATAVGDPVRAALSREHNDANVLCLGERLVGTGMAIQCLEAFLTTAFEPGVDGRHLRRVQRIAEIEKTEAAREHAGDD